MLRPTIITGQLARRASFFGHAAQQYSRQTGAAVRGHDDQVDLFGLGNFKDYRGRVPDAVNPGHIQTFFLQSASDPIQVVMSCFIVDLQKLQKLGLFER